MASNDDGEIPAEVAAILQRGRDATARALFFLADRFECNRRFRASRGQDDEWVEVTALAHIEVRDESETNENTLTLIRNMVSSNAFTTKEIQSKQEHVEEASQAINSVSGMLESVYGVTHYASADVLVKRQVSDAMQSVLVSAVADIQHLRTLHGLHMSATAAVLAAHQFFASCRSAAGVADLCSAIPRLCDMIGKKPVCAHHDPGKPKWEELAECAEPADDMPLKELIQVLREVKEALDVATVSAGVTAM